jgi:hypothetical protein
VGCAAEPDLRARAEGITPEAASSSTPHGVSGLRANGTRWSDCESFFVVALVGTLALVTAEARPDIAPVSTPGKERKMLDATLGMLAMLPVVFGVAGYAMVSR